MIRVADLEAAMARVTKADGIVVVGPFTVDGVGRGCYLADPAGLLVESPPT